MKKAYGKPVISQVTFKEPIANINSLSIFQTNENGDITAPNNGGSDNMWDDARSKGGRGFWDDEE